MSDKQYAEYDRQLTQADEMITRFNKKFDALRKSFAVRLSFLFFPDRWWKL